MTHSDEFYFTWRKQINNRKFIPERFILDSPVHRNNLNIVRQLNTELNKATLAKESKAAELAENPPAYTPTVTEDDDEEINVRDLTVRVKTQNKPVANFLPSKGRDDPLMRMVEL